MDKEEKEEEEKKANSSQKKYKVTLLKEMGKKNVYNSKTKNFESSPAGVYI